LTSTTDMILRDKSLDKVYLRTYKVTSFVLYITASKLNI
jgi:hypothetical protein